MQPVLRHILALITLGLMTISAPALALDRDTLSRALGGGIGGALGAAVGNEIGGDRGALIGAAAGAACGAWIIKERDRNRRSYDDRYINDRNYDDRYYDDRYYGVRDDDRRRRNVGYGNPRRYGNYR